MAEEFRLTDVAAAIAKRTGRTVGYDDVRYWQEVGLLPARLDGPAVERAVLVAAARQGGMSLQAIRRALDAAGRKEGGFVFMLSDAAHAALAKGAAIPFTSPEGDTVMLLRGPDGGIRCFGPPTDLFAAAAEAAPARRASRRARGRIAGMAGASPGH